MHAKLLPLLAAVLLSLATPARALLYTSDFGVNAGAPSDCDDCFSGPWSFGAGQSIDFFGQRYGEMFVGSNGYATFGHGLTTALSIPITTEGLAPMIAGLYTDLDSRDDPLSNVWVNDLTPGQLVVTWDRIGHFNRDYSVRSTFQLVIRADQFAFPADEGQIGFFYGEIGDPAIATAGIGDGLGSTHAGEVTLLTASVHDLQPGTRLSNSAPRWFDLPEPGTLLLAVLALAGLAGNRRRR